MNRFCSPDRRLRYSCMPTWFRASKRPRLKRWSSTGSWVRHRFFIFFLFHSILLRYGLKQYFLNLGQNQQCFCN